MISYELAMGLSIVAVVMTFGSLDLQEIVRAQGGNIAGWIPAWGIFYQPVAFLLLLVAGIAESKRAPFDLPEGESEIVAGYFTEYSGIKYLMFFMTDFAEIALVSALLTTFFFGGWQVPYLTAQGFVWPWGGSWELPHLVVVLLQVGAYMVKVFVFCWFQVLVRWTMPRLRYDQLMWFGWRFLLPVGIVNLVVTAAVFLLLQG
jgi:NADH-quinone oxidoreductase subunit H